MGMSYLTSLNTQLFKNIAYVGSFGHYTVHITFTCILLSSFFRSYNSSEQIVYIFYLYFCISDRVAQCGWGAGDKITGAIEEQSVGKRGE